MSSAPDLIQVPIRLLSPLVVEYTTGLLSLAAPIGEAGAVQSVTKRGAGELLMWPNAINSYTGRTLVEHGVLSLNGFGGPTILGELVIGNGDPADGSARVQIQARDQIADFANVRVNADGQLLVDAPERFTDLIVNGGRVTARSLGVANVPVGSIIMRNLAMTGGMVESTAGGLFLLEGNLTAISTTAGRAIIRATDTGNGSFDLGSALRTVHVQQGPAADCDLEISLPLRGAGSAGIVKEGAGRLRFTGAGHNTYFGVTRVRQGRLELAKDTRAIAIPGMLEIADGTGPAAVELLEGNVNRQNIADGGHVTIGNEGTFFVNSEEQIANLTVAAGGRVVIGQDAQGTLTTLVTTLLGGRISVVSGLLAVNGDLVATSAPGRPATIDGAGTFRMLGNRNISVDNGPEAIDLLVPIGLSSGSLQSPVTRRGAGIAQFGGNRTHTDPVTITDGTSFMNGSQPASPITVTGGVLGGTGTVGSVTAIWRPSVPGHVRHGAPA